MREPEPCLDQPFPAEDPRRPQIRLALQATSKLCHQMGRARLANIASSAFAAEMLVGRRRWKGRLVRRALLPQWLRLAAEVFLAHPDYAGRNRDRWRLLPIGRRGSEPLPEFRRAARSLVQPAPP